MENKVPNLPNDLPKDLQFAEKIHRAIANSEVGIIENQKKSVERINLQMTSSFRDLSIDIKFLNIMLLMLTIFFIAWGLRMFSLNEEKQEQLEQQIELQIKTINKQNQELKQLLLKQQPLKSNHKINQKHDSKLNQI